MRSCTVFLAVLLAIASSPAAGTDAQVEGSHSIRRKTSTTLGPTSAPTSVPKPPPKKPAKKPSTTDATASTASGTGSTETTTGGTTTGGTTSGGTTSVTASGGSSGQSSSSTTGTSGGSESSTSSLDVSSVSGSLNPVSGPSPARRGTLLFFGVAAVAGVAVAAATVPKRRVETPAHPLKGALNRRINLFSHLANHANDQTARPPRRGDDGGYVNADDIIV